MLALIDGDVLCYNACESRFKKDANGNWIFDLNNMSGQVEYTEKEEREYLEKSWTKLQDLLREVCENVYAFEYLMAVKGENNFRGILYPDYKLNRHAKQKTNTVVPNLRKLAVNHGLAIDSIGREADDLIRIWAEQARQAGDDYVICTIDKDLKCIPGLHYIFEKGSTKGNFQKISELEALRFYYEQLLKGDPTDNIPGIPKVGEVKARNALASCTTEEEFQDIVVEMYMSAYGDDWYSFLVSNGKMIYLQKHEDDYFKCSDWSIIKALLE